MTQASRGGPGAGTEARPPSSRRGQRAGGSERLGRGGSLPDLGVSARRRRGGDHAAGVWGGTHRKARVSATHLERARGGAASTGADQSVGLSAVGAGCQVAALRLSRMEPEGAKILDDWSGGFSRVPGVSEALLALVDRPGRARNPSDPRDSAAEEVQEGGFQVEGGQSITAGRVGECGWGVLSLKFETHNLERMDIARERRAGGEERKVRWAGTWAGVGGGGHRRESESPPSTAAVVTQTQRPWKKAQRDHLVAVISGVQAPVSWACSLVPDGRRGLPREWGLMLEEPGRASGPDQAWQS